jgi:hypothetical protein
MTTDFALAVQSKFGVSNKKVVKLLHSFNKIISSSPLFSRVHACSKNGKKAISLQNPDVFATMVSTHAEWFRTKTCMTFRRKIGAG